jgi:hypothetical protein
MVGRQIIGMPLRFDYASGEEIESLTSCKPCSFGPYLPEVQGLGKVALCRKCHLPLRKIYAVRHRS